MKLSLRFLSFLVGAFSSLAVLSPEWVKAQDEFELWNNFTLTHDFGTASRVYLELQPRFSGRNSDRFMFDRGIIRPAYVQKLNADWTAWYGYAWTPNFEPRVVQEHRFWQQVQHEKMFPDFSFQTQFRSRIEERFIENTGGVTLRYRQFLRGLFSLSKPLNEPGAWGVYVWDEFFYTVIRGHAGPRKGVDQNRISLGLHHRVSDSLRIEAGYVNHWSKKRVDEVNHVVMTTVLLSL